MKTSRPSLKAGSTRIRHRARRHSRGKAAAPPAAGRAALARAGAEGQGCGGLGGGGLGGGGLEGRRLRGLFGAPLGAAAWFAGFFLLWECAAFLLDAVLQDPLAARKIPYFHSVALSFREYGAAVAAQAAITFSRAVPGFFLGACAGVSLALLMSLSGLLERMLLPYLLASQMIPILGLAPIVFGLVKDLDASRIVISAYITFFPVSVSFLSGLRSVDEERLRLMRSLAASRWNLYAKLMIPSALPHLFSGFKVAAPMAVTAAIFVDTLSTKNGIGSLIVLTLYGGGTVGQFWPAVMAASMMGIMSFLAVAAAERAALPWRRRTAERGAA